MYSSRCILLLLLSGLYGSLDSTLCKAGQEKPNQLAHQAILTTPGSGVQEVSTAELQQILKDQSAVVLDTRPYNEWSVSHIPGALNVAPKPGVPMALYTSDAAEIDRLVSGDKSKPLVLYCNGPFCGKSKRVAGELVKAGHTNVRRYQLGAPTWRTLVGVMVIEPKGARYVYQNDQTAVWVDGRNSEEFQEGSIRGAKNIPRDGVLPGKDVGEVFAAKNDGRLPMEDHNTRIVVFAENGKQAGEIAEALAREAFHNVTYFAGTYEEFTESIKE
jgi:rhodanese-related sulfurtransferase